MSASLGDREAILRSWSRNFARGIVGATAAALAFGPISARAGAWTEPAGQGQVIETLYGWGGDGAPYGGAAAPRETKLGAQTYLQYGLIDGLTALGNVGVLRYALSPPTKDVYAGFDYSGAGLRARLWSNDAFVFSLEASAFVSGQRDAARPAQAGNTGPETDLRALAGHSFTLFGQAAFVDAQAGYRFRTEGPPSEWRGDLTLGVAWTAQAQILLQAFNTVSNGAGSPGFAAWESHIGQLSVVYALDDKWSLQVGGFATLFRRNTNSQFGGLLAVWRRF